MSEAEIIHRQELATMNEHYKGRILTASEHIERQLVEIEIYLDRPNPNTEAALRRVEDIRKAVKKLQG